MSEDIKQKLAQQLDTIEGIIARLQNDELGPVEALDTEIKEICDYIDGMDPDMAQDLEEPVLRIIARLEDLIQELALFKQRKTPQENNGTH